ncbi:hypothetical protein UCRPC4_g01207 [Phaeomoniella chlamydospora]|uniref:DUF7492 domain-containing protein n=1 Tax=Phaeomoniella chlamydospora TaxID=158046 RepID=A0A0G2EYJ6_PHACM|nr:hypothetical protein UCRPC4_g01207 [Phaeomoniella chlamydospora]
MLFPLFLLAGIASAHSWVEQLTVIAANGTFVGDTGYPRGNVLRTTAGFSDVAMTYLLPPDTRANNTIISSDYMCKDSQRTQNQTSGSPRLSAQAGAKVALRYQENGHVTLPNTQPGKPANRGTLYVYGTTQTSADDKFLSIYNVWNANGTGGDSRGVLLAKDAYDDGRCYQVNGGNISEARQAEFTHEADETMGADLWCQQDIELPSNLAAGSTYTLYWVWNWPTAASVDPNLPDGKTEVYTTCMDVDISESNNVETVEKKVSAGYVTSQNLNYAAIPTQFEKLQATSVAQEGSSATSAVSDATATSVAATSPSPSFSTVTVTEHGLVTVYETVTQTLYSAAATGMVRRHQAALVNAQPPSSSSVADETPASSPMIVTSTTIVPFPQVTSTSTVTVHISAPSTYNSPTLSATISTAASAFQIRGRNPLFSL